MNEPFAGASIFGHTDSVDAVLYARAAGWTKDDDGWWTRPARVTDPVEHEFFTGVYAGHGFIEDGFVLVRVADIAVDFDKVGHQ